MDELPPEMLELVARGCDFTSLKQLRLVNKHISSVTTPIVFEHFFMAFFPYCLENFCELARSPLAKHVKAFTFYTDLLPDWEQDQWRDTADGGCWLNELKPGLYHNYTVQQLEEAWRCYEALRASQLAWKEDRESKHFAMLPNVREANLIQAYETHNGPKLPVWKTLQCKILVRPVDWSSFQEYFNIQYPPTTAEGQAALCLLEAIGSRSQLDGVKHITKLEIYSDHCESYMDLLGGSLQEGGVGRTELASSAYRSRHRNVLEAFTPLIELKFMKWDARACYPTALEETRAFFRQAKQLRRLEVEFRQWRECAAYGVDTLFALSPCFHGDDGTEETNGEGTSGTSSYWPNLEHLRLKTNVVYPGFLGFLRQHPKLRSLTLENMVVGDASALLTEIPKVLKLDEVFISNIWSDNEDFDAGLGKGCRFNVHLTQGTNQELDLSKEDNNGVYENSVKNYLLRQADELPEIKVEGFGGIGGSNEEDDSDEDDEDGGDEDDDDDEDEDDGGDEAGDDQCGDHEGEIEDSE
ncbi:hypothetical protein LTR56_018587 [Elasticomyces elasticus]|nr:hypothetical protein LTR56_018587 [Elasticomyces elasticus]KAK3647385.1 hypothetical protein LTR22_013816 [Elasticomyces elasticus]KAK4917665.1 hypothetical protein LTR49_014487 [Elasticomyces elasticus]KAK5752052.1 hypothetical protein LTS12_017902 [Elasticomyces elasticus]